MADICKECGLPNDKCVCKEIEAELLQKIEDYESDTELKKEIRKELTEEEKEFEKTHIREVQENLPTQVEIEVDLIEKLAFALDSPNWLVAIICTKGKEANGEFLASHIDGFPGRDWLFENLGKELFEFYGPEADKMVGIIQDGINEQKKLLRDAGIRE